MTENRKISYSIDDELVKLLAYPDYRMLKFARDHGDRMELADYIAEGGTLCDETRQWLAQFLRGTEPKLKSGRRRMAKQVASDVRLLNIIAKIQNEKKCSEYAAIKHFLDCNIELNEDTVRSAIKRGKNFIK